MALKAVFFDVGETLVDEERSWRVVAERSGLQPHVVWAALGVTIERGEEHDELWHHLGIDRPTGWWDGLEYELEDLYPDAVPCLNAGRSRGLLVGIVGNQTEALERWARARRLSRPMSSRRRRAAAFGSPTRSSSSGIVGVHVRRGPWGRLQRSAAGALAIDALDELPDALASLG
jgi:hypothetical protein